MKDYISPKQTAFCPTCTGFPEQIRGSVRGTRFCFGCSSTFTLADSRKAEPVWRDSTEGQAVTARVKELRDEIHLAAVDYKYDEAEAIQ